MYFNREGQEIDRDEFTYLLGDSEYKIILQHKMDGYLISTVWLGVDFCSGSESPNIFETMIFGPDGSGGDYYCDRYPTEKAATEGHYEAMAWLANNILGPGSIKKITVIPHSDE